MISFCFKFDDWPPLPSPTGILIMPTLNDFTSKLRPVAEIETDPATFSRQICPICEYNQLRDRPRAYCQFDGTRITEAVLVCYPCARSAQQTRVQTMDIDKFQERLATQARQSTDSNWKINLAFASSPITDLEQLSNTGCSLCDHAWEEREAPMRIFFRNDNKGLIEYYVVICPECARQARDDEGIKTIEVLEFARLIQTNLLRLLGLE